MSGYKTVTRETEYTLVVERSKFICLIKGIETEADAKEFISAARIKYPMATHYCYAYIADEKGLNQKFSDDGEPHGTAGLPILNVLKNRGAYKTVAVVVRYFGGVKLGTGGLSRAYGGVCSSALDAADIKEFSEAEFYTLTLTYSGYKKIEPVIGGGIVSTEFGEVVKVKIAINPTISGETCKVKKISDILGKDVQISDDGKGFFAF